VQQVQQGQAARGWHRDESNALDVRQLLDEQSNQEDEQMNITIYTKKHCPNCIAAKQLVKSKGLTYQEVDAEKANTFEALIALHPEIQQMPVIFINGQRVGGLAGLQAALKQLEGKA
jgi:glutaredoxin 3